MTLYLLTGIGFGLTTLVFYSLLFNSVFKAIGLTAWNASRKSNVRRRLLWVALLWAALVSIASLTGYSSRFDLFPFNAAPFLILPLALILWITFSKETGEVLAFVPVRTLVFLQVFRVVVEILLWSLFVQRLLPIQMTFEGRNFDILSGVLGVVAAAVFSKQKWVLIAYNIIGLALLLNIVGTALLSMPTPFRVFMEEPANTIVLVFPFIFLPTFLVPLAYGLHFLSLRQLLGPGKIS